MKKRLETIFLVACAIAGVALGTFRPSCSSIEPGLDCGWGGVLEGGDHAGRITVGAGASACAVTFGRKWERPACLAIPEGSADQIFYVASSRDLVLGDRLRWGDRIEYFCEGVEP